MLLAPNGLFKDLLLLDAIDSTAPIDLYIRTEGGWSNDAFSIIDVMQSMSAPVNTHAIGGANSSGAMILSADTGVRYGYPYSTIMLDWMTNTVGTNSITIGEPNYGKRTLAWQLNG
ncbi:MAG: ATP-dependent protease ClpP protease subunit [Gammaproteobacteria bacterium]